MDTIISSFISQLTGRFFILDLVNIIIAEYIPFLVVLLFILFILKFDGWKKRLFVFSFTGLGLVISSGIITPIVNYIHYKPKPFEFFNIAPLIAETSGSAFPSGHASFFFALAFCLFLFNKKWGSWFLGFAILNGLARIFVLVHWPLDIIGGVLVGALSFGIVYLLLGNYFDRIMEVN